MFSLTSGLGVCLCVCVTLICYRPGAGEGHAQVCPEASEECGRRGFTRLPGERQAGPCCLVVTLDCVPTVLFHTRIIHYFTISYQIQS